MNFSSASTELHHAQKLKGQMIRLIDHLRADAGKVTDPKAKLVFNTSAEVLAGLVKGFDNLEHTTEELWKN